MTIRIRHITNPHLSSGIYKSPVATVEISSRIKKSIMRNLDTPLFATRGLIVDFRIPPLTTPYASSTDSNWLWNGQPNLLAGRWRDVTAASMSCQPDSNRHFCLSGTRMLQDKWYNWSHIWRLLFREKPTLLLLSVLGLIRHWQVYKYFKTSSVFDHLRTSNQFNLTYQVLFNVFWELYTKSNNIDINYVSK